MLGLECSRLARNNADWHRLLQLCALSDTLICDEDGLLDPKAINDRLLLGLKGTMSEAELHFLRARLQGGLLAKAARGGWPCACPWASSQQPAVWAVTGGRPSSDRWRARRAQIRLQSISSAVEDRACCCRRVLLRGVQPMARRQAAEDPHRGLHFASETLTGRR